MNSKKLQRWYQHSLSGFSQAVEKGETGKHNLRVKDRGGTKEIVVPILEEKNLGKRLAIDEKTINGTTYTLLSNRETSKIALMASTLKVRELIQLITQFDLEKRMRVKSLSRDMASNYDWLGRQAFMNAYHVIDKFHVIKNIMEQLQSIRIRYRQQELAIRRKAKEDKEKYIETSFTNGDTVLQLLARSRGLLFLLSGEWSDQQRQRAGILFKQYPEIKTAYYLVLRIRQWFTPPKGKTTYSVTRKRKKDQLLELLNEFKRSNIEEMKNIVFLIKKNLGQILNYFIAKETNAKAEALNQNLQRFINVNYGARNSDFFLYRIKVHFS